MRKRLPLIASVAAVVAMCAFIFVMSAFPAEDSEALSSGLIWHVVGFIVPGYDQLSPAEQLQWQEALQFPVRKTAHFLEYTLLGFLMANMLWRVPRAYEKLGKRLAPAAWLLTVAYAASDEFHQLFVPGRSCELRDICIDATGALLGVAIFLLVRRVSRAVRQHSAR